MTNRALVLVFLFLIALYFLLTKLLLGTPEPDFKSNLIAFNKNNITSFYLENDKGIQLSFKKELSNWIISDEQVSLLAKTQQIDSLLNQLDTIESTDILLSDKEDWPRYNIDKQPSIRFKFYEQENLIDDFYLGFRVNKADSLERIQPFFYFQGDDEVYLVQGPILGKKVMDINAYRDDHFWSFDQIGADTFVVHYQTPDSLFILTNNQAGMPADSLELVIKNLNEPNKALFLDDFDDLDTIDLPRYEIQFMGPDSISLGQIKMFVDSSARVPFIFRSSQNPSTYFGSDSTSAYSRAFQRLLINLNPNTTQEY